MNWRYSIDQQSSGHDTVQFKLCNRVTGRRVSIGRPITFQTAKSIQEFFAERGLDDLVAALTPDPPVIAPEPAPVAPEPTLAPVVTPAQWDALLQLADERIAANARQAEHDRPETRRSFSDVLTEKRERLLSGETVIVPDRYPGLTWADTRRIGWNLRQWSKSRPSAGLVQDRHATDGRDLTAMGESSRPEDDALADFWQGVKNPCAASEPEGGVA